MAQDLRVLLVEDSADDAELLEIELINGGFAPDILRVETAETMGDALAGATAWDVVLSDYHLPRFSASAALDVLKASGRDLPFIILSGVVRADEAVSLLKRGAHDFLDKAALARLVPAIQREVREARERESRRQAEERVRVLSLAIEQSPVSVVITDRQGFIGYVNPKFQTATGYGPDQSLGRPIDFIRQADGGDGTYRAMWEALKNGQEWRGEFCNQRADGQVFWEYATLSPLADGQGTITNFVAVKEDITQRRSYEERLLRQANYDDLTGLPNRVLMLDRLDQAIAVAHRQDRLTALIYIDLDRFKTVNDSLGHAAGDLLLKEAALRLAECIREGDTLARTGGDEFVVILPGISGRAAIKVADRVVDGFAPPFHIAGHDYFVTASMGISLFPTDGTDGQVLLRNAELAMYKAKDDGRGRYRFFTHEIDERMRERLRLESQLRGATARGEMLLQYQPLFQVTTGQAVGMEALVRWQRPSFPLLQPGSFIPLAEEVGLIAEIGDWVVANACATAARLFEGEARGGCRVAVNVSPRQLQEPRFGQWVSYHLNHSGLRPDQLELEITESMLMDDSPEAAATLTALCDLGIRLSIDDFGTGYSSLGYLQRYPFHTLKIDKSFVQKAPSDANTARLVETIVAMARGLRLETVAEGVETADQLEFLKECGCDLVQGYLLGRPMEARDLARTLG
jgi:diguanylate cyclase (GGDEF)-like protein/PAS domain S-box-containing protein